MRSIPIAVASLALAAWAGATPCRAESLASSASSAGSTASGSASDSIHASSEGSSGRKQEASGNYRVIEVAELRQRAGVLRVKLRAVQTMDERLAEFTLDVPRDALARRALAQGDLVTARPRPYGIEFAYGDGERAPEAFFLALADDWQRELDPHVVEL
jgi:hypothetical protein